jgi:hypothetical protein
VKQILKIFLEWRVRLCGTGRPSRDSGSPAAHRRSVIAEVWIIAIDELVRSLNVKAEASSCGWFSFQERDSLPVARHQFVLHRFASIVGSWESVDMGHLL